MGIKDMVRSMRDGFGGGGSRPLRLTEAARDAVRRHQEQHEEDVVFFVVTQPTDIGFRVGVGFEPAPPTEGRELRDEADVPLAVTDEDWVRLSGYTIDFKDDRFVTFSNVTVHVSETPNPDARKFILNRKVMTEGSATYHTPAGGDDPALVRMLLEIPQVRSVFLIDDFCSVSREPDTNWDEFQSAVGHRLQAYFSHGGAALDPPAPDPSKYSEVERKIITVLEDAVRPAVARDGGDIAFAGYDDGVVQLYMLGSCSGCPSSTATLRMGVEKLLKDSVPEIREVVAID